jgi:N-carbamoylputrescine amidase
VNVDNFALAEPLYSTSFIAFSALAKELSVVIIVPFRKRMAGVYHNSAYIIDTDGSEAGLYRKMHIRMILIFMKILFYTWRFRFKTIPTKGKLEHLFGDQWWYLKQLD